MTITLRPAVLLDRDGVINRVSVKDGITRPPDTLEEFEFLPGVIGACWRLVNAGWSLVVVTNQPDVARGTQTRAAVEEMHLYLVKRLPILGVLTCWHDGVEGCDCRKPKTGLLLEAARRWNFDLRRSVMVGDRWSDIVAGKAAGCLSILVKTPNSGVERCKPDFCVTDLASAADWIIGSFAQRGAA